MRIEEHRPDGGAPCLRVRGVGLDYWVDSIEEADDLAMHLLVAAQVLKAWWGLGLYDQAPGTKGEPSPRRDGR